MAKRALSASLTKQAANAEKPSKTSKKEGEGAGQGSRPSPAKPIVLVIRSEGCEICFIMPQAGGKNWAETAKDERGMEQPIGPICIDCKGFCKTSPFSMDTLVALMKDKRTSKSIKDAIQADQKQYLVNRADAFKKDV